MNYTINMKLSVTNGNWSFYTRKTKITNDFRIGWVRFNNTARFHKQEKRKIMIFFSRLILILMLYWPQCLCSKSENRQFNGLNPDELVPIGLQFFFSFFFFFIFLLFFLLVGKCKPHSFFVCIFHPFLETYTSEELSIHRLNKLK